MTNGASMNIEIEDPAKEGAVNNNATGADPKPTASADDPNPGSPQDNDPAPTGDQAPNSGTNASSPPVGSDGAGKGGEQPSPEPAPSNAKDEGGDFPADKTSNQSEEERPAWATQLLDEQKRQGKQISKIVSQTSPSPKQNPAKTGSRKQAAPAVGGGSKSTRPSRRRSARRKSQQ